MIINELKYPWLATAAIAGWSSNGHYQHYPPAKEQQQLQRFGNKEELFRSPSEGWSLQGQEEISQARKELLQHGAVAFPDYLTPEAVTRAVNDMKSREDDAFTTNTVHTPYLTKLDTQTYSKDSIYNHHTQTIVASTAYDELPNDSVLKELYNDPRLLKMVASIVTSKDENSHNSGDSKPKQQLFLSDDPLGCCSVNVFRPGYYHGFHYDESEFSVTLMLQDASDKGSGLFQYTDPIRSKKSKEGSSGNALGLELDKTADVFRDHEYDAHGSSKPPSDDFLFAEHKHAAVPHGASSATSTPPQLHTLDFRPGTLLVLAGSRSLHRVTQVRGDRSRFVAVLTFASKPGFCNTPEVQEMFWGRTASSNSMTKQSTKR